MTDSSTRRSIILGGAAALLSGCAQMPDLGDSGWVLTGHARPAPSTPATPQVIESNANGVLRLRQGRDFETTMTLTAGTADALHWVSPQRLLIATRNGRVVRSVGFRSNLRTTRFLSPDPVATGLHRGGDLGEAKHLVDLPEGNRFGHLITSRFEVVGGDRINVFGAGRDVILVRESNVMTPESWSFENLFWIDPQTGFVWRSVQHIAPGVAPIEIDVLRPPRVAQ
jgi:hypothetical protein